MKQIIRKIFHEEVVPIEFHENDRDRFRVIRTGEVNGCVFTVREDTEHLAFVRYERTRRHLIRERNIQSFT